MIKILEPRAERFRTIGAKYYLLVMEVPYFDVWDLKGLAVEIRVSTIKVKSLERYGSEHCTVVHEETTALHRIMSAEYDRIVLPILRNDEVATITESTHATAWGLWSNYEHMYLRASSDREVMGFITRVVRKWLTTDVRIRRQYPPYEQIVTELKRHNRECKDK